jgi:hypothetical protein
MLTYTNLYTGSGSGGFWTAQGIGGAPLGTREDSPHAGPVK